MSILNPTTFLDFVQRSAQELRFANVPTTTVGQSGQALDLCLWVNEAWRKIQIKHKNWQWMRLTLTFPTVGGTTTYTPVSNVDSYERDSFRYYTTSVGLVSEVPLPYMEYDRWRDTYLFGSLRTTQTVPQAVTITPTKEIAINCPLAGYTVLGDYYRTTNNFANDGDTVDLPSDYRMLIVYDVMVMYGASKSASELYTFGQSEYGKLMSKLEARYLPEVQLASALA